MDNGTHAFFALALARTGLDRTGRLVAPALVVSANLPDLDSACGLWGQLAYLDLHRGISHSVLGLAVQAPLVALAFWVFARRHENGRFLPLLLATSLGLASHLALDSLNSYGVRPWIPFSDARYFGDTAFIVDPWMWLTWGGGAFLASPATGRRLASIWAGLAGFLAAIVTLGGGGPFVAWSAGVVVLALLRLRFGSSPRASWLGLVAGGLYVLALAGGSRVAHERGRDASIALVGSEVVVDSSVSPQPAVPWKTIVLVETPTRVIAMPVDLVGGAGEATIVEKHLEREGLVRGTESHRVWRRFARHPFIQRDGEWLDLRDARFGVEPRGRGGLGVRVRIATDRR